MRRVVIILMALLAVGCAGHPRPQLSDVTVGPTSFPATTTTVFTGGLKAFIAFQRENDRPEVWNGVVSAAALESSGLPPGIYDVRARCAELSQRAEPLAQAARDSVQAVQLEQERALLEQQITAYTAALRSCAGGEWSAAVSQHDLARELLRQVRRLVRER